MKKEICTYINIQTKLYHNKLSLKQLEATC